MSEILIRKLKKGDADEIRTIDTSITMTLPLLDYERIVQEEIDRDSKGSFVAEISGRVVGYMISYISFGNFGVDRCAWIAMFGVDPKLMGRGIGKRLAEETFRYYKEKGITNVYTSVRWDFTDILSFFKTLGFTRSDLINLRKALE